MADQKDKKKDKKEDTKKVETTEKTAEVKAEVKEETKTEEKTDATAKALNTPNNRNQGYGNQGGQRREFKKNKRTPRHRRGERSEFDQKIISIRRVTRVSAGGRRFSFSVSVVIGNRKGKVGVGIGKAGDTALAIEKAVRNAKRNIIQVKTTDTFSIPHQTEAKYSSAKVIMIPSPGRGIVAGSALRDMLELGGIKDVVGKIVSGSKNKLNIARATIKAFESLKTPKSFPKKKEKVSK